MQELKKSNRKISFLVRVPAEVAEEIEWRFLEPAESLVKAKIGEMLEEYGWEFQEGEVAALDSLEVREVKNPIKLLLFGFYRLLLDACLGRDVRERVFSKLVELYKFETKMHGKAKAYIQSYAHEGDKSRAPLQAGAGVNAAAPTVFDR